MNIGRTGGSGWIGLNCSASIVWHAIYCMNIDVISRHNTVSYSCSRFLVIKLLGNSKYCDNIAVILIVLRYLL